MSFYTATRSGIWPGRITGNILTGLCERVCILTKKVFDACIQQEQFTDIELVATNFNPPNPTLPLTFISANSTGGEPLVSNLVVTRFDDRPNFARVECDVTIPLIINYVDAAGIEGTALSSFTVHKDVILYVPQPAIVPYTVNAFASFISTIGTFVDGERCIVTACVQIILRVVAEVQLLVPSYGYCPIPPCTSFDSNNICPGIFSMPLFPTAVSPLTTNT